MPFQLHGMPFKRQSKHCKIAPGRTNAMQSEQCKTMEAPGVVLIDPKYPHNVGATIRACSCFDIKSLVWTGQRVNPAKYERLPREERMKGYKRVDFRNHQKPFELLPKDAVPVCVEVFESSEPLTLFEHPENAIYVFDPEDGRIPQVVRRLCHRAPAIPFT